MPDKRSSKLSSSLSFLLLFSAFILLLAPGAWADSNARIVRLSYLTGDVQADRGDGQGFDKAILNMPVVHGSRIKTGNEGQAEIEFEDGSTVRLASNSVLDVNELSLNDNGDRVTTLSLEQGLAYFDTRFDHHHDIFKISVDQQTIVPAHSSHFRIKEDAGLLNVSVFKGNAQISNSTLNVVEVRKGETLTLKNDDPGHYELAKKIDHEDFYDNWDKERRDYRSYYAANSGSPRYMPAYGLSDLSFYGGFFNAPGLGSCWRPYGAAYNWNPLADGSWVNYPGMGWTFVSAYPWGWTPFYYGQWQWASGTGYCWSPGLYAGNQYRHVYWRHWKCTPTVVPAHGPHGPISPSPIVPPHPPTNIRTSWVAVGHGPTTGIDGIGHGRLQYLDQQLAHHHASDLQISSARLATTDAGHSDLRVLRTQDLNVKNRGVGPGGMIAHSSDFGHRSVGPSPAGMGAGRAPASSPGGMSSHPAGATSAPAHSEGGSARGSSGRSSPK